MYRRIIINDTRKNKLITITTMAFVAAAAMLVSLAAILLINLVGAMDTLIEQGKTPHFLQMHSGQIDEKSVGSFADSEDNVKDYQILEFLNVDGTYLSIGEDTLSSSTQDNGFCTQSKSFDYLLDMDGKIIQPSDGEVYLPIYYMKSGFAKVGDTLTAYGQSFTVAGFLRDSQMNSSLSSSKRFLISENDFEQMREYGSIEYLIEFQLHDTSTLGEFEADYVSAGLPANGPSVTFPQFKLINVFDDGVVIAVILLISLLVIAIAFLCIRFTLLAKIEDDYREIGVMKAIGLRVPTIKRLYLAKYALTAAIGCLLGFALSLVFRDPLLENIRLYMGESGSTSLSLALGIVGVLIVFLAIVAYVNRVLNQFRRISAASALRFGAPQEKKAGAKRLNLSSQSLLPTNMLIGVKDVLGRVKLYSTILIVLMLAAFILIVPQNLYSTISSTSFVRYMGIGLYDMNLDIQQTENIASKVDDVTQALEQDDSVSQYTVFTQKSFTVLTENDTEKRLKVGLGDHTIFPVEYSSGTAPTEQDEIALSALNADDLEKQVGDTITIETSEGTKTLTVCGIYSDITNGGKTAKATFLDDGAAAMAYGISVDFTNSVSIEDKVSEYAQRFHFAKINGMDEMINQTFGTTIQAIQNASYIAIAIAIAITILVVLLFLKMLLAKDQYAIAVMKALGYTRRDVRDQYLTRSLFVLVIAVILGVLLANTLGSGLAGIVMSQLGITSFTFSINVVVSYLICPLLLIIVTLFASLLGTTRAGQISITERIRE
ncbi:MAG: ABC transporter permease [Lachnospiraceae bacterium]